MSILAPNKSTKKQFEFINETVGKKQLSQLLSKIYAEYGTAKTGSLANNLKNLGFKYATTAGLTISIDDLDVPKIKKELLSKAEAEIEEATTRYLRGEITEVERYTKVIDTWSETTNDLTAAVVENFNRMNPVYMMAFSGARGNISQIRQLVGMRGLMADSQGQIIDIPIKTNFREGLSVTEYIISSYGARKGLVDTALKTADSGYLTRRLVDVAQDVIISEEDCGSTNGVLMKAIRDGESVVLPLAERVISRTSAVDVFDSSGELLVQAGQVITPLIAKKIAEADVQDLLVRSALTCDTRHGVCRKCYGWSLTNNKLVDLGEAIGIMAAQSIGEPGTQLTMRTFHTGGAFTGRTKREFIRAEKAGTVSSKTIPVRDFRTRHGDNVKVSNRDSEIVIESSDGSKVEYHIPYGARVYLYETGTQVQKDQPIAEFEPGASRGDARRLTEKATKDVTSDMSGEIFYDGFDADERRDRQGNITRSSNRAGTIWVLGGNVYSLPGGSALQVQNAQPVFEGDVLAETLVISENGGEVRLPDELQTEDLTVAGSTIKAITKGKELTIIIASVEPANASLVQTKKELLWRVGDDLEDESAESFIIKAPQGTTVENGSIIAELLDDSVNVPTSGEIRYEDIEVDEQQILLQPGKVLFIPEEIHQVSKDISLKSPGIESGMFVKAGTELISGITSRIDGIVEIQEDNDIIHEVIIRPGELHRIDDPSQINVEDGTVVDAGTEIYPGIVTQDRSMVTVNFLMSEPSDDDEMDEELEDTTKYEYAELLIRPVYEYEVGPRSVQVEFSSTEEDNISIVPVTQIQFKDGDKVRQIEGASLLRTSLVLQMKGALSHLKGVTELHGSDEEGDKTLKVVVLEDLIIRRESATEMARQHKATQTELLVEHGQIIDPGTPVVKTQVLARTNGTVSLGNAKEGQKDIRRLLLVTPDNLHSFKLNGKPSVKPGDFIRSGEPLTASGDEVAPISGKVYQVDDAQVILHEGRPYLISVGTQLQAENHAIAQQGDLIATLVFERQKTGDIVQGLPRVEELLEGRKPKDSAIIAPHNGTVEVIWEEDLPKVYLLSDAHGREEVQIPLGANVLVEGGEKVSAGQPLTDGSINPHDILQVSGIETVRTYLVEEVQRVYRSQGVEIADKHIEVIVRQMTKKVQIDEGGDTFLLPGELVDLQVLEEANAAVQSKGGTPSVGHSILLGITKASLNTESFISAASFQETTRVLTEAAVEGKMDVLRGLKENVIIGRLIPAGTGFAHFKDERIDMAEEEQQASKSMARKPSAILEEIESMFGSPEISEESLGQLLLDDSDLEMMSSQERFAEDDAEEPAEETYADEEDV
ncbi:MAG: DNA-directed RNA polymerase subunit beta'' [Candidatus Melainabacteria bacterium]|nr:DNA-directed RNA polymerase subunit beta'' [Candidatus Melainabacteria bacterium]